MSERIPCGLCQCGCGQRTRIAPRNWPERGHVKGEPYRFVVGHKAPGDRFDYAVEDRGFETPCHIWSGSIDTSTGYARLFADGRQVIASRYVYEQAHGRLPAWPACHVDHRCRVVSCVRLDHLEAVTASENIRRGNSATLTKSQVAEIRYLLDGGWVQRDIATAHGVSPQQITKIKLGQRWAAPGGPIHAAA